MRGGSPPPPPRVLHLHNFLPTSEVSLNVWRLQKHHQTGFFPRCSLNFCKPQINPTMTWWSLQTVLTCVQNMLYHGHIMKPSGHLSQQQVEAMVAMVALLRPTWLPNRWLEFKSHLWIFLRITAEISIVSLRRAEHISSGAHWKSDYLHPSSRPPKQLF